MANSCADSARHVHVRDSGYDRPMTKAMTPEEERTKAWLEVRGYKTEYEPDFIPEGEQRPDFWAEALAADPPQLWVEVKQIDQDASTKAMSMAVKVERATRFPADLHGIAHMGVSEGCQEQSVQAVVKLFQTHAPKHAHEKTTLAFVQHKAGDTVLRRAAVERKDGVKRLWVRGTSSSLLACPYDFCEDEPYAEVRFWDANGDERKVRAYEVLNWTDDHQCGLTVWLDPSGPLIDSFGVHSGGSSNTRERTVRSLEKANVQLRSAVALRPVPAIVMLVPMYDYVDDQMIQAGCYGVLRAPINVQTGAMGDLYHGEDGVFRPTKNRHISAAIRLWKNGEATYFPNPHAHHKIGEQAALFKGLRRANVSFSSRGA